MTKDRTEGQKEGRLEDAKTDTLHTSEESDEKQKEMNILILGQSGVGKSTWINSIVNYLRYENLKDAEEEVICVIPAHFTMIYTTNEKIEEQVIEVGNQDTNEVLSAGKSATQEPKAYTFVMGDRKVRLIDTPGLGDTEGIDTDIGNMQEILDHIKFLNEIHGICILLKSNERRMDVIFKYCIVELLSHLHKSAAKNILFCFTNSRSSNYSPGDSATVLKSLLQELNLDDAISLCRETMFCLDNEAFRFLCSLKYPNIPHDPEEQKIQEISWKISVKETKRLFDRIKELPPYNVNDTSTLCTARQRMLSLIKPITDITQIIQLNIATVEDYKREINISNLALEELINDLYFQEIELVAKPVQQPRTVCTSEKCIKIRAAGGNVSLSVIEYVQICHDPCCCLTNITQNCYPQPALKGCKAMNSNSEGTFCRQCGCSWDMHMQILYSQERKEKKVINSLVESEINARKAKNLETEEQMRELKALTEKYEAEQKEIIKISSLYGAFIRENALISTPYNTGFKDYLKYLIEKEKRKAEKTQTDEDLLEKLINMMLRYDEQVRILEESTNHECQGHGNDLISADETKSLSSMDIMKFEEALYELELVGQQIKQMSTNSNDGVPYAEEPLPFDGDGICNSFFKPKPIGRLRRWYNNLKETFGSS